MSVKVLTSKDLHIAVKRPDGIPYLMNRFQFADEEAMFSAIMRVSPGHGERFVKDLLKTRQKQKITASDVNHTVAEEVTIPVIYDELPQNEVDVKREEEKSMRLDDLLQQEQELSNSLCILEGVHKELVSNRRDILSSFVAEKNYLLNLRKELTDHEKKVKDLYGEYQDCFMKMHELNNDMRAYASLLSELRTQIEEIKKIVIFVYDTGVIEVENTEMPVVSDATVKREFDRLITLPQAEEVTIKSVKAIAKLRVMLAHLPSNVELIFDSAEAQALYEAV